MTALSSHPQRNSIRLLLRQNQSLQSLTGAQWGELEPLLAIADYRKGDPLVRQGDEEMEQFFILEGMLKRVVSNPEGREMILRFPPVSFPSLADGQDHCFEKPLPVCVRLVLKPSRPGDVVFDAGGCTGPMSVAAIRHGRRWVYAESNAENYHIGAARTAEELARLTAIAG